VLSLKLFIMFRKTLADRLAAIALWFRSSEMVAWLILAVLVGLMSGLGAVAFRWLIKSFQTVFLDWGSHVFSFMGHYYIIVIPAIGGLLVGLLVYFFAREAKGHGVPEVMESVALRGGRIRPRVALVKILASSICIGSGGSVGREGPIVQIGSTFGSTIGQWLKLPEEMVKVMVACGAAGGIAATFNAPIAGVLFALEVILGRVVTRRFGYVVISAVVADFLAQAFLGNVRAFPLPEFGIVSGWEFGFYVVLGILAAFTAQLFVWLLYWSEDRFDALKKIPEYIRPVIGGLAVGAIGLYSLDVLGVGYEGITKALSGEITVWVVIAYLGFKILATSITLGSGGSGGVFAPSLFMGAMLGTAVGIFFGHFFPNITAPAGAYGIVGMAAVFSGAARAPFSAILIIFEMTGNYAIILPLMTAVVISTVVSRALRRESIYTLKLRRRGVDLDQEELGDVLRSTTVKEAMTKDYPTLPATTKLSQLFKTFQKTGHHGFPVIDEKGNLVGVLTETDIAHYLDTSYMESQLTAGDIVVKNPFVAYPEQMMFRLLDAIESTEARIPVVDRETRKLLGVIGRHEVISVYQKKTKQKLPARVRK
jgi:CIC family chloride channel protein